MEIVKPEKTSFFIKSDLSIGSLMGSQMSQYASLVAMAQKTKHKILLIKDLLDFNRGVKIVEPFDLTCEIKSVDEIISTYGKIEVNNFFVDEKTLFDEKCFSLPSNKSWNVLGLFHTFIYWDEYKDLIFKEFKFKQKIYEKAKNYLDKIPGTKVSIHFRRGDYLQVSSLNLTSRYYQAALEKMASKIPNFKLIVFSDDIKWCKENIKGDSVIYCENFLNYEDMCIMSLCDHNIIANSSFSWWAAYLNQNPNKIVICPDQYLNVPHLNFMNGNYFPKDWISIKIS